jgi:putative oxidoreductase
MAMDIVFLIGRIVFAGVLLVMAFPHFKNYQQMAGYAGSKGVPAPSLAIIGSGVVLALIEVFFLPVTLMMHDFWMIDGEGRVTQQIQFNKNVAIAGAALIFLAIPQPWTLSLSGLF